jgi:general secretion pathway protein D
MRRLLRFSFLLAALAGLLLPAVAQPQPDEGQPQLAVPPPASPVGMAPTGNRNEMIDRIVLRDESLAQVLNLLERLTGRSVIRPQALPSPTFTFNSLQALTREEAVLALESLLSINGIGVSPMGEKFMKVVPIANIRTEAPELVIGPTLELPASGRVVSKLFRLQYLDSQTFQTQIQPFLSPGFGTIIPFQNSNAVIVTDTISNLQRLEYVVSEVDRPSRLNIETRFYTLSYARASEVANQIRQLIDSARTGFGAPQQQQQGGRGQQQQQQQQVPILPTGGDEAQGGAVSLGNLLRSNVSINADDRTNQIIVIADPANLPFFGNLIEKLDIQAEPTTSIEVMPLQHADAAEVATLLSQFVAGRAQTTRTETRPGAAAQRTGPFNQRTQQGQQGQVQPGQLQQQQPAVQQQVVQTALEERDSQFSTFMTIQADERSNALVVSGTRNDLGLVRELVERIDVLLAQVRIEVVIAEVSLSDGSQRGIDSFNFTYNQATREVTNASTQFGPLSIAIPRAVLRDGSIEQATIQAVFNAARTQSNINILSSPTIVTSHNREASILVGQARPIITSTDVGGIGGVARSSFRFEDIGIELRVKPLIGPNDVIQLEIEQKIDDVVDTVLFDGNEQPIIGRRQASSFVSVRTGEMIVLGGLQSRRQEARRGRMFILGDIPILGEAFRRKVRNDARTELLVFIRPTVLRTTDDAYADALDQIQHMPNAAEVLAYPRAPEPEPQEETALPARRFHK